jgi:DNA-binding response OmpR family regulator
MVNMVPGESARIVVLARPDRAREVETMLRSAGHEVYRTPDAAGVATLAARIRPHLVVIAQDIPWADATETPHSLARRLHEVPILIICDVTGDGTANNSPACHHRSTAAPCT